MPNVVIRNGAVIAANLYVASDVPPYAIVGKITDYQVVELKTKIDGGIL